MPPCWKCGRPVAACTCPDIRPIPTTDSPEEDQDWARLLNKHHMKGSQNIPGKPNPDRHTPATHVISVRIPTVVYHELLELIANSPRPHDTVGGYIRWLITTQALRKR